MVRKMNLGKVVKRVLGYNIRIMLESKTFETKGRTIKKESRMVDSGKLGVYAGRKKLIKSDFVNIDSAINYIDTELVK